MQGSAQVWDTGAIITSPQSTCWPKGQRQFHSLAMLKLHKAVYTNFSTNHLNIANVTIPSNLHDIIHSYSCQFTHASGYSNELHEHSCTDYTGTLRLEVWIGVHHRASFCFLLLLLKVPVVLLPTAKGWGLDKKKTKTSVLLVYAVGLISPLHWQRERIPKLV